LRRRREREQGTMSLFEFDASAAGDAPVFDDRLPIPDIEFDKTERLRAEKEMLGLYVSDHPLMGAERALRRFVDCSIAEVVDLDDGTMRTVAGVVTALQRKYTKRGDLMATFVLEDLASAIEVMVFPKTMLSYGELLAGDAIVTVKGRIDRREESPKLIAMEITRPEVHIDRGPPVRVRVKVGALTNERVQQLRSIINAHPGDSPVFVHLHGPDKETVLRLGDEFCCDARNGLFAELRVLFGADCIG
jgi:DNA polymerase-3 subunit alpha